MDSKKQHDSRNNEVKMITITIGVITTIEIIF